MGFGWFPCVGVVVQLERTPECPSRGVSVQLLNTLAVLCRLPVDAAHRIKRTPYQTPHCLPHCCPPVRLHRTLLARSLARPPESAPSPAAPSAATRSAAAACAPATPPPGGQDPQTWAARHSCTVKSPFGECPPPPSTPPPPLLTYTAAAVSLPDRLPWLVCSLKEGLGFASCVLRMLPLCCALLSSHCQWHTSKISPPGVHITAPFSPVRSLKPPSYTLSLAQQGWGSPHPALPGRGRLRLAEPLQWRQLWRAHWRRQWRRRLGSHLPGCHLARPALAAPAAHAGAGAGVSLGQRVGAQRELHMGV